MKSINEIAEAAVTKYEHDSNRTSVLPQTRRRWIDIANIAARIAVDDMRSKAANFEGDPDRLEEQRDITVLGRALNGKPGHADVHVMPGYLSLLGILCEALDQAQFGKGAERHNLGGNIPFERQRMQQISELIGSVDGMTYQACKKITEGVKLPTLERQVKELLGAINYIAGMIIFLRAHPEIAVPAKEHPFRKPS